MDVSKEHVEEVLKDFLREMMRSGNQESAVRTLEFDRETMTCTVKLDVTFYEPDNYIGFEGY